MIPDPKSLFPNPFYKCNRHAKYQPFEIIYISNFEHDGMHIFLCSGAQFTVHIKECQQGSGVGGQGSGGKGEVQQKTNTRPLDPLNP